MPEILIGTSGYDYPEWRGVFYPAGLKRADFLPYYATQFNALELNSSFYKMPTAERLLSFWERSGGALKFSVKANRLLTHEIGRDWKSAAQEFLAALNPLAQNKSLASALFQFPQSFHYTDQNRMYLSALLAQFRGLPVVVEFRHAEWIRPSVFEGLEKRNASIVFCDMPQLKNLPDGTLTKTPFVGSSAYIRMHGRNENAWYNAEGQNGSSRYCYEYSDDELSSFVPIVRQANSEGKKVQMYFNNHPRGSGAKNARRMRELVETAF